MTACDADRLLLDTAILQAMSTPVPAGALEGLRPAASLRQARHTPPSTSLGSGRPRQHAVQVGSQRVKQDSARSPCYTAAGRARQFRPGTAPDADASRKGANAH
eukprot:4131619-Pleurochrysis_carterae.AAC.2